MHQFSSVHFQGKLVYHRLVKLQIQYTSLFISNRKHDLKETITLINYEQILGGHWCTTKRIVLQIKSLASAEQLAGTEFGLINYILQLLVEKVANTDCNVGFLCDSFPGGTG